MFIAPVPVRFLALVYECHVLIHARVGAVFSKMAVIPSESSDVIPADALVQVGRRPT